MQAIIIAVKQRKQGIQPGQAQWQAQGQAQLQPRLLALQACAGTKAQLHRPVVSLLQLTSI